MKAKLLVVYFSLIIHQGLQDEKLFKNLLSQPPVNTCQSKDQLGSKDFMVTNSWAPRNFS